MTDLYLESFVAIDPSVYNDANHDVWFLGRRIQEKDVQSELSQLLWVSYRCNFPQIGNSNKNTDAGWGCMLRSTQMMIANGLLKHEKHATKSCNKRMAESTYRKILLWFGDTPDFVYSVHNLVEEGGKMGKRYGEWFGPSSACQALVNIKMLNHANANRSIKLYLRQDGIIYKDEIESLQTNTAKKRWDPVIALLPVRLGLDKLNPAYYKSLAHVFTIKQTLGIVGGRPNASFYFYALQGNYVYYLDPHVVQEYVNMDDKNFPITSYQAPVTTYKLGLGEIDPSLALGFYFATRASFEEFCATAQKMQENVTPCVFTVCDKTPSYNDDLDFSKDDFDMDM